jgi:hypothetical protein
MIYHFADFDPNDPQAVQSYREFREAQKAENDAWAAVEDALNRLVDERKKPKPQKNIEEQIIEEIHTARGKAHDARIGNQVALLKHQQHLLKKKQLDRHFVVQEAEVRKLQNEYEPNAEQPSLEERLEWTIQSHEHQIKTLEKLRKQDA